MSKRVSDRDRPKGDWVKIQAVAVLSRVRIALMPSATYDWFMSDRDYKAGASSARNKIAAALRSHGLHIESSAPSRPPNDADFIDAINKHFATGEDLLLEGTTITYDEVLKLLAG